MLGSPPPPERQIRFADGSAYRFLQLRWQLRQPGRPKSDRLLVPTVVVPRQGGPSAALPRAERDNLGDLQFTPRRNASTMSWAESVALALLSGAAVGVALRRQSVR
jgi:hypothetical protein